MRNPLRSLFNRPSKASLAAALDVGLARMETSPQSREVDGERVKKGELETLVAEPTMTGVRQAWSVESAVDGLTPDRLAAILRSANMGELDGLLTLAEEMEEREPHYASVLQTRKLAVAGLERQISWADGQPDDPRADDIQAACAQLIAAPEFESLIWHCLDAIAKPYAAPEIMWENWKPVDYEWRDPRWFRFDRETGRKLLLKDADAPEGKPLPPHQFVVAISNRKSGLPARGGLARLVAFSFVCKLYGVKDWLAYAEIFGIPLRLGKYDAAARPEDVEVLKRAVFGLGSDAAAVIPQAMTIEFPTAAGAGGAELFHSLATWIDNQVSKAVIGQTGTTDMQKGGGFAQATVLNEVRGDLTKADAKWIMALITGQVLRPFVAFNFGPDAPVPSLLLVVDEPEDVKVLSEALERLVPLGLKVGQAQVRKKLKLSEPDDDDELLTPPVQPGEAAQATAHDQRKVAIAAVDQILAEARARRDAAEADISEISAAALDGWEQAWGQEVASVVELVRAAASFDELVAGLNAMAADLSSPAAARSLAGAMFQAAVVGEAQPKRKA